jgi:hypothetical protein
MNAVLLVCLLVGSPIAAFGLHELQMWLEQWDYNRHAQD